MTLVFGLSEDPILTLQKLLKHRKPDEGLDNEFLTKCLTTNIKDPSRFLKELARTFDIKVPRGAVSEFRRLNASERSAATAYDDTHAVLEELCARGYRLGLISNLWPFPVRRVFKEMKLGAYFEHLVYSFEVGVRKPDRRIFDHAAKLFGVNASECVMIGDSLSSDVEGSLAAGMDAILIDRSGKTKRLDAKNAFVARSLTDVQRMLA
jgi:haloacid dehalogenase superfamily, subfamily IA, variant 3 with third motif having DD or ED/haloacid dehalogenase superfamily, subfamily IA, variant 1 with third motif having Dx(3-4)D or Dx(3-4)E